MQNKLFIPFIILAATIFSSSISSAQQNKQGIAWIHGVAGLNISRVSAVGQMQNYNLIPASSTVNFYIIYGHSNICDSSGNLVLLSDGLNVYDSALAYISNGRQLNFDSFYSYENGTTCAHQQGSIILPFSNGKYKLINLGITDDQFIKEPTAQFYPPDRLLYHDIDMTINGGKGSVTNKMQILGQGRFCYNSMTACRHANGKDWWLLKQCYDSIAFYKYLIREEDVIDYGLQQFANINVGRNAFEAQLMFNHKGTQLMACGTCEDTCNQLFLFDFNRCTGELSFNKAPLLPINGPIGNDYRISGGCFSPNDSMVYLSKGLHILQYDLYDTSSNRTIFIGGMDTSWAQFYGYSNIYPALDGKIYIGNWGGFSKQMSVINKPNIKGMGAEFCPKCYRMDTIYYGYITAPPNMPNYALGADSSLCWPLQIPLESTSKTWRVFPNPNNGWFTIKYNGSSNYKEVYITITDALGKIVFHKKQDNVNNEIQLDISNQTPGIYTLKIASENLPSFMSKISLER